MGARRGIFERTRVAAGRRRIAPDQQRYAIRWFYTITLDNLVDKLVVNEHNPPFDMVLQRIDQ